MGKTVSFVLSPLLIGPGVYIYGASGPDYGSYEVNIDGNALRKSAHATANTTFPHLIYSNTTLSNSRHTLKLSNLGALDGDNGANKFLFDYLQATVQLGPAGLVYLLQLHAYLS